MTEASATQEESEFQRHVETSGGRVQSDGRQIVAAELAFLDDPLNCGQPRLPSVILLKGAASKESEMADGKDYSVEDGPVVWIKSFSSPCFDCTRLSNGATVGAGEFPSEHGFERTVAALPDDLVHTRQHGLVARIKRQSRQRIRGNGTAFVR